MHVSRIASPALAWVLVGGFAPLVASAAQVGVTPLGPVTKPKPKPRPLGTLFANLRLSLNSLPDPDIEELDFGHFFQNEERTLCVLASGRIVEIHDPSVFDIESLEIPTVGVTSAAVLPESVAGGAAQFFDADGAGLASVPGALSWVFQPSMFVLGGDWIEAEELQTYQQGSTPVLLAVSADRLSILTLVKSGSSWVQGPRIGIREVIHDVVALDFDGDGAQEIAALANSGVHVLETNGSTAAFFPSVGTDIGEIERVRDGGSELIAWATLDIAGEPVLEVLGNSTMDDPLALEFPVVQGQGAVALDLAAMTAGDSNADGLDDLVLTDYASHRAVLLWNQGTAGAHFTAGALAADHLLLHLKTPASDPGTGNDCAPLAADVDGDGREDLAFGLDTTGEIVLFTNVPLPNAPAIAAIQTNGSLVAATTYYNAAKCEPPSTSPACTEGVLNLAFNLTQQVADSYDYVEAVVWRQPVQGGPLVPLSVSHTLHPFFGTPPRPTHQWIQVPIPETWVVWPAGQHYYARYRFCRADVAPNPPVILSATPSSVAGFTLRHTGTYSWPPISLNDPDFDYLQGLSGGFGFLLLDSYFPDSSAVPLTASSRPHLGSVGGVLPALLGNNYVGALYTKVGIPPPPPGGGLEVTAIVLVNGPLPPW